MPKFTSSFLESTRERVNKIDDDFLKGYVIDIDGDMAIPPLRDIVRYLTEYASGTLGYESKESILKQAILGKKVTIHYKGRDMGSFVMNNMSDPFDLFEPLKRNPTALMLLMELATSAMVGKSLPPQVESGQTVAAASTQKGSQESSNGKQGAT